MLPAIFIEEFLEIRFILHRCLEFDLNMPFFNYKLYSFCDVAVRWQMGFQDPATPLVEGMQSFHGYLAFFIIFIDTFVCCVLFLTLYYFFHKNNILSEIFTHSNLLEIIWTLIPALFLISIAIPSFSLLYSLDELANPMLTVKILGYHWCWSYPYFIFLLEQILLSENVK